MSSRRWVLSTTRLSSEGHSSGRSTEAKASAWKYSSTSKVRMFCTAVRGSGVGALFAWADLGQPGLLLRIGHELHGVGEPGHQGGTGDVAEQPLGEPDVGACGGEVLRASALDAGHHVGAQQALEDVQHLDDGG